MHNLFKLYKLPWRFNYFSEFPFSSRYIWALLWGLRKSRFRQQRWFPVPCVTYTGLPGWHCCRGQPKHMWSEILKRCQYATHPFTSETIIYM